MSKKSLPILHVDGSLTEYIDKNGVLHQVAGLGGYLVVEGKIVKTFHKSLKDEPHLNHHEEYAILEGMKWVIEMGYDTLRIKTDSMYSVVLFNNNKKILAKVDKFFLMQFLMLEVGFDCVEIIYHSRADEDLSHNLSRTYLNNLPKDIIRLHSSNHRKKKTYSIKEDATRLNDEYIKKFLCKSINKWSNVIDAF